MKDKQSKNTKNKTGTKRKLPFKKSTTVNLFLIISLILIVAIIPLIMYVIPVVLMDAGNLYWDGKDTHYDIFSYTKMQWLIALSVIAFLAYLISRKDNPFQEKGSISYYIPMGIFLLFALLSSMLSEYKEVSFYGFLDRYEGLFVLLAYMGILFLAINTLREEKAIKFFFTGLLSSAFIVTFLGSLQYFGFDYFQFDFVQKIITPKALEVADGGVKAVYGVKSVFSTLSNPNYVGSYTALLLPVIIVLLVAFKSYKQKAIMAVLLLLTGLCWIGSDSRAGLVGGLTSLVIIAVMFRKKIIEHKKAMAVGIIVAVIVVVGANAALGGDIGNKIKNMLTLETKTEASGNRTALINGLQGINDASLDANKVTISTEQGVFGIAIIDGRISCFDGANKIINTVIKENTAADITGSTSTITVDDIRFSDIRLEVYAAMGTVEIYHKDFKLIDFILTEDGLDSNSNRWMVYRGDKAIEKFGFEGNETMGSGRGYIWSRSIPLLKDTIFWGNGPDTFALYFPQYDYLGKLITYEIGNIFVDKAHNFYLQTALNTGIISLLALLAIFVLYIVTSVRIYIKEEFKNFTPFAGLACFTAVCGYLGAAFFNDSVVSVAPVFWVLLGLGIGINTKLKGNNVRV